MKNRLFKTALASIAFFQSASLLEQDYSGHHSDSEGGHIYDSDFGFALILIMGVLALILLIILKFHK
jgi:hypothetical protein